MRNSLLTLFCFVLFFTLTNCERNFSPLQNPHLTIKPDYVAVTEAYLRLHVEEVPQGAAFQLLRNDSLVGDGLLTTSDTTVIDTALQPAHSYTYKAILLKDGTPQTYSPSLKITTLDTTTHDFSWEITTIESPYGSGFLNDVAIVNENDIWAVGAIFADSAKPWQPYNAVHWDGGEWELKRIKTNACGGVDYPPIKDVIAFSFNDILFSHIDGSTTYYDGNNFTNDCRLITQLSGSANKMWGISSNDLYAVSGNGFIAHYDGQGWQRIESGTELPIQDIWGAKCEMTGKHEIYCIASTKYYGGESKVMKIENNEVFELSNNGLPWSISGIWFKPPYGYYVVGDGIFYTQKLNKQSEWIELVADITGYYTHAIRGNDINDIFMVGAYNTVIHFNGMTWKNYSGTEIPNSGFHLHRLDYRDDMVAAVGYLGGEGIVLTGKRIE